MQNKKGYVRLVFKNDGKLVDKSFYIFRKYTHEHTVKEIADHFQLSEARTVALLHTYKLRAYQKKQPKTKAEEEQDGFKLVNFLKSHGYDADKRYVPCSLNEISQFTGIPYWEVEDLLRKLKIGTAKSLMDAIQEGFEEGSVLKDVAHFTEYCRQHKLSEVADRFNCSKWELHNFYDKHGIKTGETPNRQDTMSIIYRKVSRLVKQHKQDQKAMKKLTDENKALKKSLQKYCNKADKYDAFSRMLGSLLKSGDAKK